MDISSLGIQNLNPAYAPLSSTASAAVELNSGNDFAELLRRTESARTAQESSAAPSGIQIVQKSAINKNDELYELCMELETFLIKNLIKSMRSTVQKSNLIDTGFAGEIYEDMLYDEYAKTFSRNANFGFAEMAYRELTGTR